MDMTNYKNQHKGLVDLVGKIAGCLDEAALTKDASVVAKHLNGLAGGLQMHLMLEDESLYPRLLKSTNAKIVDTSKKFMTEMGGLKATFMKYKEKWPSAEIQKNPKAFITETKGILKALADRVEREEGTLYPLAETA